VCVCVRERECVCERVCVRERGIVFISITRKLSAGKDVNR
jgi:hypothetical protein